MPKGKPGTGPRGRPELLKGGERAEVAAAVREMTGWSKTVDAVQAVRAKRAALTRWNGPLTDAQERALKDAEEKAERIARAANSQVAGMMREVLRDQNIGKVALIQCSLEGLPEAFRLVFETMTDKNSPISLRLECADRIVKWATVRPADAGGISALDAGGVRDVSELTLEDMQAASRELQALIDRKRSAVSSTDPIKPIGEASPLDSEDVPDSLD
jgi:hypothetical protein